MRRYLDQELDELKLTTDNLEKIYQKILKRYGIDLKEVLDDKLSWEIVAQKIIEKNDIKSADVSVEMMRYKKINEQTLTLAGKWSGGTEKNRSNEIMKESLLDLVSKKFVSFKKPMNPSKFQTHPAVLELFALCAIPAVSLKGRKNTSANNA